MENFVFQRQEASLGTGWGLGEAKGNDLVFFSFTPNLAEYLPLVSQQKSWEARTMSDVECLAHFSLSLGEWDCSNSSGALWCVCMCVYVYIYTHEIGFTWQILSLQGRIWGKSSLWFLLLVVSNQGGIFSSEAFSLSFPFSFVPLCALT